MTPAPVPRFAPTSPVQPVVPVYTSSTGVDAAHGDLAVIGQYLIEEVAQLVFDVWATTASADQSAALLAGRPNVPPQIDRILLADIVTHSGICDIPTYARFGLRDAFWAAVTRG